MTQSSQPENRPIDVEINSGDQTASGDGGILDFNHSASGFGEAAAPIEITRREAIAAVEHWFEMLWAVESNWGLGTTGSWEVAMWQYATSRIQVFIDSGHITEGEAAAIDEYVYARHPSLDDLAERDDEDSLPGLTDWIDDGDLM